MIRPEVVKQLTCPSFGLATSWIISRQGRPAESLDEIRRDFRRELWPFAKVESRKDNAKAKKLREQANECYRKEPREIEKVLRLYNEAICWAAVGSVEESLGYGNRSAVYFNQKRYGLCLRNVERAKGSGYPEEKLDKLLERERKCLKALEETVGDENRNEVDLVNELELRANLELVETAQCGRSLTSKKELKVGQIALMENPFLVVLEPEAVYCRCNHCGRKNELDLIPCRDCVSAMYCSDQCRDEAHDRYHKFECEIVEDLKSLFRGPKPTRMFQLALRLFWMAMASMIEDREKFLKGYSVQLKTFRNPLEVVGLKQKLHLHVLANGEPNVSPDHTGKGVTQFLTVLVFKVAVEENGSVQENFRSENEGLLLEVLYKLVLLAKGVCDQSVDDLTCVYPLLQMVNHSCAPNAERFVSGTRSMLVVKRPIKEGEQILMCYFPNGSTDYKDKIKRKTMLLKEFEFDCQCLGCSLDYPLLSAIEENAELRGELETLKYKSGDERLQLLEDFLQRNDDKYPQKEIVEAWSLYKQERSKRF
ncbi:SET and MYND domain-containing protein 4-like [Ochlerotatus camptorhynchus]|uniref:SET and MYND domain-containing protein 4-like n=1 Tax=Ochlerotatus camptorhynchus TaxID=644619 RepID=UPI0031E0DD49